VQLHKLSSRKKKDEVERRGKNSRFSWSCSIVEFMVQSGKTSPKHTPNVESHYEKWSFYGAVRFTE